MLCNDGNRVRTGQQLLMPSKKRSPIAYILAGLVLAAVVAVLAALYFGASFSFGGSLQPLRAVKTLVMPDAGIFEPFGVALDGSDVYVSDGRQGMIWKITPGADPVPFASGLSTPSGIAFASNGDLYVADTGSHTIKKVDRDGTASVIAGVEGRHGDVDGPASTARFNGPIGLAVLADGGIAVTDTYNDKVKLIKNGVVSTLAGSTRGFQDAAAANAKFDTPCGIAVLNDGSVLVADTLNSRIRMISPAGIVTTLAGNGEPDLRDGTLFSSSFYRPTAVSVGQDGSIFIGDGNSIRAIRHRILPVVETISDQGRGFIDGPLRAARFNRISGIVAADGGELIVADSNNAAIRSVYSGNSKKGSKMDEAADLIHLAKRTDPTEFRTRQPARWPYDPPDTKRDIAGTLGEIRGEVVDQSSQVWFHNGLDIAGAYGEKARLIRDDTVLDPLAAENFGTLRELIRFPTLGYIHIRLGRDSVERPFGDDRFQFDPGMSGVRVRRGAVFKAGEVIGTLNPMNHVHLIAGPPGDEMNALDALVLPGVADTTPPVIEETAFFDQNWLPLETKPAEKRISLAGKTRIVVRAFDRMDGNPERRRLGVFRLGYQLLNSDHSVLTDINWSINFYRNPSADAVKFAYATGSKSGATGETIFRYIVTNKVSGESFGEGFLDVSQYPAGQYVVRVFAADYFGNTTSKDIDFEVKK